MTMRMGLVETFLLLCLLVVVALTVMWIIGPMISEISTHIIDTGGVAAPDLPGNLEALPLVPHALNDHTGEQYTARTLPTLIQTGNCLTLDVYFCPADESIKYICEPTSGVFAGLVVGMRGGSHQKVVTGYQGSQSYWAGNVQDCYKMGQGAQ